MSNISMEKRPSKRGRDFWGPPVWTTLHSFAAAYKPENAEAFKCLLESFSKLLPCDTCKANFNKKLEKFPIDNYLRTNHEVFFWTYIIHDDVNQEHNKLHPDKPPKISPPFSEVKRYYFEALHQECQTCQTLN